MTGLSVPVWRFGEQGCVPVRLCAIFWRTTAKRKNSSFKTAGQRDVYGQGWRNVLLYIYIFLL